MAKTYFPLPKMAMTKISASFPHGMDALGGPWTETKFTKWFSSQKRLRTDGLGYGSVVTLKVGYKSWYMEIVVVVNLFVLCAYVHRLTLVVSVDLCTKHSIWTSRKGMWWETRSAIFVQYFCYWLKVFCELECWLERWPVGQGVTRASVGRFLTSNNEHQPMQWMIACEPPPLHSWWLLLMCI